MKIYKKGNYIYLVNASGDIKQDHANEVKITKTNTSSETYSIYSDDLGINYVTFSELTQENGLPYANIGAWELWYAENTGFNPASGGSGAGTIINTVSNFSSLPDPTLVSNDFYWVSSSQGYRILGTYKANGLYYSNGTSWEFIDAPTTATQSEVNAGTLTDKYLTPSTFENATKWTTKMDANVSINALNDVTITDVTNGQILRYNFTTSQWENVTVTIGNGDMLKSVYDTDNEGIVDNSKKEIVQFINKSGATITKGTIVYLKTSSSSASYPEVLKANASTESTSSKTIGAVFEDVLNDGIGYIVTSGEVRNINTSAYNIGDKLWLSTTDGLVTTTPPIQPNHTVFIGTVTRSQTVNGRILYAIQNGYELNELHNVLINGSLANNDIIQYDSATSLWKNKQLETSFIPDLKGLETFRGISINNNTTTVVTDGGVTMSSTASTLAQSVASTNFATKQIRLRYYSTTVSSGRYTGTRGSALLWYIHGGFKYVCDFNISDTAFSSGCQQFYGLAGQTTDLAYGGAGGTLVSTLTNIIGVGSEVGDLNLQVFHNDGSGTATKIDLGVDFPANRTAGAISTTVYSIKIYNKPNSTDVKYEVVNNETGAVANGIISTNLPLSTQGLNFFASRCMSTTSLTNSGQFDLSKLGVYSII
jgi:hypothetical protein